MILAIFFSCLIQVTDSITICNASCTMHLENNTSLIVLEHPLFKKNEGAEYAEKQPCRKVIIDTISKQSFSLNQSGIWADKKKYKGVTKEHIGTNNVKYNRKGTMIYLLIEPDNCTCQWVTTFEKKLLPFVEKSLTNIVFVESPK